MGFVTLMSLTGILAAQAPVGGFLDSAAKPTTLWRASNAQPLVVIVTKGFWCPACMAQLALLDIKAIQKKGAKVVGLNSDNPKINSEVKRQLELTIPILSDPDGQWLKKMELWDDLEDHPLPAILFYDRCGDLVYERKGRRPGAPDDRLIFEVLKKIQETKRDCPNFT